MNKFKVGGKFIYEKPESKYNGKIGTVERIRDDGKVVVRFNNDDEGFLFAANPLHLKPYNDELKLKHIKEDPYGEENWDA